MLPLLITVTNKETGAQIEAGFRRSPVRIGRNHLNDLAIDESFVSQWHGLIRFDADATKFLDLGSTNGTSVSSERLQKNVEVDLAPETRLAIGPLRLSCARIALRDDQILPRRASAFTLGGTSRPSRGVAEGGTVEIGGTLSDADIAETIASGAAENTDKRKLVEMARRQRELMEQLTPLYATFEAAHDALTTAIQQGLADAPADERATRLTLLQGQFPKVFKGADSAEEEVGLGDSVEGLPGWFERLAPGSSGEWAHPDQMMERAGAVLETFARSLLELDKGQKQILTDLNLERGSEANSLPRFSESQELLKYLFDASVDGRERIDELSRSFADIALHQLGLIAGAQDGARALLSAISPHAIGAVARGALVRTSAGFGDFIWPFAAAGNYYKFAAKHLEVSTGERFTTHLFGAAFQRAYYRVTGRRS